MNNTNTIKKKRGGYQPGGGRPKGSKSKATLTKEEADRQFKARVYQQSHRLQDAQFSIALGQQFLFKIKTYKGQKSDPQLVKDEEEIRAYLNGEFEGSPDEYYFMTTKEPDNKALDSLFNRGFGRAPESIDITSGGDPIDNITYVIPSPHGDPNNQANP